MIEVKIEEILEERDLSIYWLAEESGLSYPTVYNLVKNKTKSIQFKTIAAIMHALNIYDFNKIFVFYREVPFNEDQDEIPFNDKEIKPPEFGDDLDDLL